MLSQIVLNINKTSAVDPFRSTVVKKQKKTDIKFSFKNYYLINVAFTVKWVIRIKLLR